MPAVSADLASSIHGGDFAAVQNALLHLRPPEAAEAVATLPPADQAAAFRVLPRRAAARVFEYLPPPAQKTLTDSLGPKESVGSSRVDLQACKLEYSIVSPK